MGDNGQKKKRGGGRWWEGFVQRREHRRSHPLVENVSKNLDASELQCAAKSKYSIKTEQTESLEHMCTKRGCFFVVTEGMPVNPTFKLFISVPVLNRMGQK